jgi:hypothetical protein
MWLVRLIIGLLVLPVVIWGALALFYQAPGPPWVAKALAIGWGVGSVAVLLFARPFWRAIGFVAAGFALVLLWWNTIAPSNERDWLPEVARPPYGELRGDVLTLHNVRNFDYRSETDFTPQWEDRTYDLARLRGVDLFLSYWSSPAIAHTILSWTFEDGPPLAVSIETRKERGEEYSAVQGFFKRYELYYVAADERDLVRLRTNYRGEHVYLYHLVYNTPQRARAVLLDYVKRMNELAEQPAFYNALTHNCTTTIRTHTQHVDPGSSPFDWRFLLNGYGDQMLYERGRLDTQLPFDELKRRSLIDDAAKAADRDPAFSQRIREALPVPPPK